MKKPTKFKQATVTTSPPSAGNTKRVERAVLKTLSYRAIFNYPLSFHQLQNYLLTKKPISRQDLAGVLPELEVRGRVVQSDGRYHLKKIEPVSWRGGSESSMALIQKAQKISKTLVRLPWIKFIGVTGSVAAFNAAEQDDIDVLIIAEKKRLWITRGFVFLILKILGELRKDSAPNQRICPNILLDETSLPWSRKNRNVYVAHEIVMLYPIFDRDETYLKFLQANSWVLRFFGNLKFSKPVESVSQSPAKNILDLVESVARNLQLNYMKPKRTTEVTKENIIHFNRDDHTKKFLSEFERVKMKELV